MKRFLLDSDTCISFLRRRHEIANKIVTVGVWNCGISQATVAELRYGAECSDFSRLCHQEVDIFCEYVSVISINDAIISVFAAEKAKLRRMGQLIPDFDLLIGATALCHDLTIVTNNVKHFGRMPSLRIENWMQE